MAGAARTARTSVRFRRSPHLVSYWSAEGLVYENYATGLRVAASPRAGEILDLFGDWRALTELRAAFPHLSPDSLARAVSALERSSLLQRSDRPRPEEARMDSWGAWNPAAGFLHFSTRKAATGDIPDLDVEIGERYLRRKARTVPMPAPVERRRRGRLQALPPARSGGELPRVLLARRTWRRFSRRPLALADLATLLGLTWGVQRWVSIEGQGKVPLKTSPSGGARHSLEAYVLALRVEGLKPGLYHYLPDRHALERLRPRADPRQAVAYLNGQWWYAGASALFLMTSVFERVRWRYELPRAYRVILAECGHFCQTFLLVATWLGLAPFCSMALADARIERDLGIDGIGESVLYAAGVGGRPRGTDWAPLPSLRGRRRRPASPGA